MTRLLAALLVTATVGIAYPLSTASAAPPKPAPSPSPAAKPAPNSAPGALTWSPTADEWKGVVWACKRANAEPNAIQRTPEEYWLWLQRATAGSYVQQRAQQLDAAKRIVAEEAAETPTPVTSPAPEK